MGTGAQERFSVNDRVIVWQTLASRRAGIDAMMWQTPALGMTAQAFLLTLALAPGSSRWARLLASMLSLALSFMVTQLMAKHRRHEMLDSLLLERLEDRFGLAELIEVAPHAGPSARHSDDLETTRKRLARSTPGWHRFWRMSSYEIWMAGMGLFAVVALAVIVLSAVGAAESVLG